MNNKIIGFTISRQEIDHSNVDVFDAGLTLKSFRVGHSMIYVWGINNIDDCFLNERSFSLSFPVHDSLSDRNVVVKWDKDTVYVENDWLGSIPVFYNTKTETVSTLINKAIESTNSELDPEGLNLYLDIGYSALETTPVKDIRFLRYYSKLTLGNNDLHVQHKEDPVTPFLHHESDPQKIIELIKSYVEDAEQKTYGSIIIPTSGGFDSRLLNIFAKDKKKVMAFTYGISKKQAESIETVKAKRLSETLKVSWKQIELGEFNSYAKEWFKIFGPSTHLHGMYHIEFYKKIRDTEKATGTLLSGIIGDAWSGNVAIDIIDTPEKIKLLGYSHGMNFSSKYSLLEKTNKAIDAFFEEHKDLLRDDKMRVIMSMRFKIILLSYLMTIPEYFGYPAWTPFLNMDIALGMLNISDEKKSKREWQSNYFRKYGLDLESMDLTFSKENMLNYESIKTKPVESLDIDVLSRYIKKSELKQVNKKYLKLCRGQYTPNSLGEKLSKLRVIAGVKRRLRLNMNFLKPYYDILVLKSIELLIKQKTHGDAN